jgi:hypothetical protein
MEVPDAGDGVAGAQSHMSSSKSVWDPSPMMGPSAVGERIRVS